MTKIKYKNKIHYYFINKLFSYKKLSSLLADVEDSRVLSGPFRGLLLGNNTKWGNLTNKYLGTYELELHPVIEELKHNGITKIFDIGGAEGYYSIGLLNLLPGSKMTVWEMDEDSRKILADNALKNKVSDRMEILGKCSGVDLLHFIQQQKPDLIVMDAEGAEIDLITPEIITASVSVKYIIECHSEEIVSALTEMFARTHRVEIIKNRRERPEDIDPGIRLPWYVKFFKINLLRMVNEGRPMSTPWLIAYPGSGS
ncbi:MAG: hypothetical protein ACYC1Q_04115 [Bacteroidia bacterium]